MKYLISVILSLLFLHGCNKASEKKTPNAILKKGLNEKFKLKGFNAGVEIYLKPDFTFVNNCYLYGCTGGYRIKLVTGHYKIESNQIIFNPEKLVLEEDWENFYDMNKEKFDTIPYYESDSTSIQTKYWLIQNNELKFLVSESKFDDLDELFYKSSNLISLANLYNSNIEENAQSNLLSNRDTMFNFRNLNLNNIPDEYSDYFLDKAIEAKITRSSVHKVNKSFIPLYKIDVKDKNRIRVGMRFYAADLPNESIHIVEINQSECIAEGVNLFWVYPKLKVKTVLSTEVK